MHDKAKKLSFTFMYAHLLSHTQNHTSIANSFHMKFSPHWLYVWNLGFQGFDGSHGSMFWPQCLGGRYGGLWDFVSYQRQKSKQTIMPPSFTHTRNLDRPVWKLVTKIRALVEAVKGGLLGAISIFRTCCVSCASKADRRDVLGAAERAASQRRIHVAALGGGTWETLPSAFHLPDITQPSLSNTSKPIRRHQRWRQTAEHQE